LWKGLASVIIAAFFLFLLYPAFLCSFAHRRPKKEYFFTVFFPATYYSHQYWSARATRPCLTRRSRSLAATSRPRASDWTTAGTGLRSRGSDQRHSTAKCPSQPPLWYGGGFAITDLCGSGVPSRLP
jgi:hypothetical protein